MTGLAHVIVSGASIAAGILFHHRRHQVIDLLRRGARGWVRAQAAPRRRRPTANVQRQLDAWREQGIL